jgi:hypothetical protein
VRCFQVGASGAEKLCALGAKGLALLCGPSTSPLDGVATVRLPNAGVLLR